MVVTSLSFTCRSSRAVCQASIDLAFVLDSSGSVGRHHFSKQLVFINKVIDFFNISSSASRVALVRFSSYVQTMFSLGTHSNKRSLQRAVSAIGYTGGYTATGPALQATHKQVFQTFGRRGARPRDQGVPRVVVLLTDGRSNVGVRPFLPARDLQADGVNIFVVGVGALIDRNELRSIASAPTDRHTFLLRDFDEYASLVNQMRAVSCDGECCLF